MWYYNLRKRYQKVTGAVQMSDITIEVVELKIIHAALRSRWVRKSVQYRIISLVGTKPQLQNKIAWFKS